MKKQLAIATWTLLFGFVAAGSVSAVNITFMESYLDGGSWDSIYAQGFSPGVEPDPDLGLNAGDGVFLESFEFYKSGNDDNPADLQLAIISPFFSNIKTFETTSSFLVGLSDNMISGTADIATGDPIAFDFSNTELEMGTSYGAVFVSQSGDTLTPELVPALVANYVEDPPGSGTFVPESNYGTNMQFEYAVSNFISETVTDAFFNTFSDAADANFKATFSVIPEPASWLLGVMAVGTTALVRRRRH